MFPAPVVRQTAASAARAAHVQQTWSAAGGEPQSPYPGREHGAGAQAASAAEFKATCSSASFASPPSEEGDRTAPHPVAAAAAAAVEELLSQHTQALQPSRMHTAPSPGSTPLASAPPDRPSAASLPTYMAAHYSDVVSQPLGGGQHPSQHMAQLYGEMSGLKQEAEAREFVVADLRRQVADLTQHKQEAIALRRQLELIDERVKARDSAQQARVDEVTARVKLHETVEAQLEAQVMRVEEERLATQRRLGEQLSEAEARTAAAEGQLASAEARWEAILNEATGVSKQARE